MARIHLFEFEDLAWFPACLRNYMTDFLQFLTNAANLYKPVVPLLAEAVGRNGNAIVDLASGGGGGILRLNEQLLTQIPDLKVTLTDFYPNSSAFEFTGKKAPNIGFVSTPVDARHVPESLRGLRTMFLSFHHFKPADARGILQNAIDSGCGIAIFETQERSFKSLLAMLFSPVTLLLVTPFIRPFNLGRLLFTYFIPILPLAVLWDGIVSALRTYSESEMQQMVDSLNGKSGFDWRIGRVKSGPGVVLYLIGNPKHT